MANGLRLIVHEDATTPLVTTNIIYKVGSRDELQPYTGLAHLMEHLMFTGSKHADNFDSHLQKVGAINNAYTSQDITNYYVTLPSQNLETVLWLESDRMMALNLDERSFQVQQQVVIEEFKESFLNKPYGDMWIKFNDFTFDKHPYKWLPIGLELSHVESITLQNVKDFYQKYYQPNNAVICIAGNVRFEEMVPLVEKWFGDIPSGKPIVRNYQQEATKPTAKSKKISADVPYPMLLKGWNIVGRTHPDFYAYDLLSDILGNGQSSFLFQEFVLKNQYFTDINSYVTATFDPGLLVFLARPLPDINLEKANEEIQKYLMLMAEKDIDYALQKVKNNVTSLVLKNCIKVEDRASVLAISETMSCVEDFEEEIEKYHAVTTSKIKELFTTLWSEERSSTLFYGMKE